MLGSRQPLDGPIFQKLEDAEHWCIYAMIDHYDRRLGMSDARIEPFKGMVNCGPPPDPALVRDIERICEEVAKGAHGEMKRARSASNAPFLECVEGRPHIG
jgi:hypothetical protein